MLLNAFSDFEVILAAGGLLLAQGCRRRYYSQAGSRLYCFISREIDAVNGGKWRLHGVNMWHFTVSSRRVSLWMGGTAVSGPL